MKKIIKYIVIVFLSLLLLVAGAASYIVWFVFTPDKITPVVTQQAANYLTCQVEIGKIELTFFRTFPRFGIKVDDIMVINEFEGAGTDTLAQVGSVIGTIDLMALWRRNELLVSGVSISNGTFYMFTDSMGTTNFDIMVSDTTETTAESTDMALSGFIDLESIDLKNVNVAWVDYSAGLRATVAGLDGRISGTMTGDSLDSFINISALQTNVEFDNDPYLTNAKLKYSGPLSMNMIARRFWFSDSAIDLDNLDITLTGMVAIDTLNGDIKTDLLYNTGRWRIKELMEITPPSYKPYFDGITADGWLTSNGNVTGRYNRTEFPLIDAKLNLENGQLKYVDLDLPLSNLQASLHIVTDLGTDSISYVTINNFSGKTPNSTFSTSGKFTRLFTDPYSDLITQADILLDEFQPLIPDSLITLMTGRISGKVESSFSMSEALKVQIEKMKLTGSLYAQALKINYDSLWVNGNRARIEFILPNPRPSFAGAGFGKVNLIAGNLSAGKLGDYTALLKGGNISAEFSDVRDTTSIPFVACTFKVDSLSASMDTIQLRVLKPAGRFFLSPNPQGRLMPVIKLDYTSQNLKSIMGSDSVVMKNVHINTEVVNDDSQKDIFLKWLANGFIDIEDGVIVSRSLTYPLVIPSIKMDFSPERFRIHESRMIIDRSDFELSGQVVNILSYFRGDSIMRGEFVFESENTDVTQLMNLTNGIGNDTSEAPRPVSSNGAAETATGPYMVPKGIDILLTTNIRQASFGVDTATNISGNVRVNDGILVLEDLFFTTPAAKMQLTAMYRTPRENHLFMGIDYHMFDIEIEQLLKMIPDIDTLMPMLRSFRGKGEFHLAVEGYFDSTYALKKSTLRGASSIRGENLVLMDGETFSEIARTLRFNKQTENRIDSLSAEFTIFRDEIDVYPFLIVMDQYRAVVEGRHNFDLSFRYHISVVDSPLPVKFGIDVTGDLDNMKYQATLPRFAELYRPISRRAVQYRQLELRRMIREALIQRGVQ